MDRKEFLVKFGMGVAVIGTGMAMNSCKKYPIPQPGKVDFTIDLSDPKYSDLQKTGRRFVYIDNVDDIDNPGDLDNIDIIVAHLSDGSYVVASKICTHSKCYVELDKNDQFPCPTHGALFDTDGSVLKGPAKKPIFIYKTELIDNELRIYS